MILVSIDKIKSLTAYIDRKLVSKRQQELQYQSDLLCQFIKGAQSSFALLLLALCIATHPFQFLINGFPQSCLLLIFCLHL